LSSHSSSAPLPSSKLLPSKKDLLKIPLLQTLNAKLIREWLLQAALQLVEVQGQVQDQDLVTSTKEVTSNSTRDMFLETMTANGST
jgi:hypothetical protein